MWPILLLHYTDRVPRQWPVPSKYYNDSAVEAVVDSYYFNAHKACLTTVEKTDLFRYAIIYERGGIYCDADVQIVRHPSKWPEGDALIGVEFQSPFQLNQWTFAARRALRSTTSFRTLIIGWRVVWARSKNRPSGMDEGDTRCLRS